MEAEASDGRSTHLDHLLEDWLEVLGAAEHERIDSEAQLGILVSSGLEQMAVVNTGKFHFVFHKSLKEL
jgi:hypothetical protein